MNKYYNLREVSRARRAAHDAVSVVIDFPFYSVHIIFTTLRDLFGWLNDVTDNASEFAYCKTARRLLKKPSRPAGAGATDGKQSP
jgi:hypothetical protein